jgi:PST family polysaccharide transporter
LFRGKILGINLKNFLKQKDKKRLLENFASLSVLQVANYILPLITIPYLVRILGVEKYGLIAFAQAFIQYFIILTDFGFNLSATRDIAVDREDSSKVSEIFSSVMLIKTVLIILSTLILIFTVTFISKFKLDWQIYVLSFGMVIGNALFPIWFFQGMEEMKYTTILNVIAKTIFTVSIFILVRHNSQYLLVPLLNSLGFIVAGIIAQYIIFRKFRVKFFIPKFEIVINKLKDSAQFFLSRVSVSIYTTSNAFILGLTTSNEIVGYYTAAEKIYSASRCLYQPIQDALYPYIAKEKKLSLFKKIFYLVNAFNLIFIIFVYVFSGKITHLLYGSGFEATAEVLRIFSIVLLFVVPSSLVGYPYLGALGYFKCVNLSVVYGSVIHLAGLLLMIFLSQINIYSVVLMVLVTEICVLAIRVQGIRKNDLMKYLFPKVNREYESVQI